MTMTDLSFLPQPLIAWYKAHRKPLPWRLDPTPYHVWISEVMLQQTRIEAAMPYYERFIAALPDVHALATVDDDVLMKYWQGLGYYSRARNLKKAAALIESDFDGVLPADTALLRKLPGIGEYTAGAIASIAYGLPEPAVDGNVLRVIMRITDCEDDVMAPTTKKAVTAALSAVYPSGVDAALFTEGLMELGETLCLPNTVPKCGDCPLKAHCAGFASGRAASLPVRAKARARRIEERTVFLFVRGGKVALRKRGKGLLAGLWEFPGVEGVLDEKSVKEAAKAMGIAANDVTPVGRATHVFTHIEWRMTGYRVEAAEEAPGFIWKTPEEIARETALPSAFRAFEKMLYDL